MNERLAQLAARRAELERRSAAERRRLRAAVEGIDARIRGIERGVGTASAFLRRPGVVAGGAVLGLLLGPRRVLRYAGQAVLLRAAVRRLLRFIRL